MVRTTLFNRRITVEREIKVNSEYNRTRGDL